MNQPIIILGMHRSGTSMLTRLLREQGLFLGHKFSGDDEATFFQTINRWMHRIAGTNWDRPLPAVEMLEDPEHVERIAAVVSSRLSGPGTYEFLGPKMLRHGMKIGVDLPFLWGFKDPRSSINLPVWLHLFPEAKLLRIRRHGVDVAASLRTRYFKKIRPRLGQYTRRVDLGLKLPARNHIIGATRCADLDGGLAIWAEYERTLDRYLEAIPAERQMTIRYEDYLGDFECEHRAVADFVGIDPGAQLPQDERPDPSRAFAHRGNEEYLAAAQKHATLLAELGYGAAGT